MNTSQVLITFWVALSMTAGQERALRVRVYNFAGIPKDALERAKAEAQRVFRTANVETEWVDCPAVRGHNNQEGASQSRYRACTEPLKPGDLFVRLMSRVMESHPAAAHSYGYVMPAASGPSNNHAFILCDRVRERARQHQVSESRLLGHVLAHELSHVLLGDDEHTPRGIMMANWGERELVQIDRGFMTFTPQEGARLRASAIARVRGR
jgi:hypothetical protein